MNLKSVLSRTVVALSAVAAAGGVALAGAGSAAASPAPAPRLGLMGEDIWTLGDHDNCRGAIHIGVDTDPAQHGLVTVVIEPRGMTGDGPGWARNRVCRVPLNISWTSGKDPLSQTRVVPLAIGPGPQRATRVPVNTGSGLALMGFNTNPLPAKGVSYYLIVP